jgi:hypothetical protein
MSDNKIDISIVQDNQKLFQTEIEEFLDKINRPIRGTEKAINTDKGSAVVKNDGQVNISAGLTQRKASPNGIISDIALETSVQSVTHKISSDDIVVNNHKLNNKFYELTGYKEVLNDGRKNYQCVVGNFTVLGTVLTKCWEPHLQKYVLIRRLANVPVYSPAMGAPEVLEGLKINPNTDKIQDLRKELNLVNVDSPVDMVMEYQSKLTAERLAKA